MSRVLLLGGRGRLGATLARLWAKDHAVTALARPELDLEDAVGLEALLRRERFDVMVNAAALTNVDRCETAREEAERVNVSAPALMARVAASAGKRLIHFSTDYVFDGGKQTLYTEDDEARPLSHYGRTKLAGEKAVLAESPGHLVARVSWVFGPDKPSFVDMIVERAQANDRVEAIADKTSCPTSAADVAGWIEPFLDGAGEGGIYHACNFGSCTWQEYGQEALDGARRAGVNLRAHRVDPIPLDAMKNFAAPRPPHTALSTSRLTAALGRSPRPWQDALQEYLFEKFRH